MEVSFIYPNQLFDKNPVLSKNRKIYILRHPYFFSDENYGHKFHKQKILLHFLSTEDYQVSLIGRGFECEIIEMENYFEFERSISTSDVSKIHVCRLNDIELEKSLVNNVSSKISINFLDSPMFYENNNEIIDYFNEAKKYQLSNFYKKLRIKYKVLIDENNKPTGGKWSFDVENRKSLPKEIYIPEEKKLKYEKKSLEKYKKIINSRFSNNPGTLEDFNYPINRTQALEVLSEFFIEKFRRYGDFQDAIVSDQPFLFHSIISPSLNLGLITPKEIVDKAIIFSKDNYININSLEGLIRQILGWREFIRGIYLSKGNLQKKSNFFEISNDLPKSFYSGKTSLIPVDDSIKKVNKYSYLHHIERLMILGNIMLLLEIDPKKVNKWFMELFIDSYDWVMVPNIFGMSQFADGGLMSTKPYISSSNYIQRMSNYAKGNWSKIWDSLYWQFIANHESKLVSNPRMSLMVNIYRKKTNQDKMDIKFISESFKEKIF